MVLSDVEGREEDGGRVQPKLRDKGVHGDVGEERGDREVKEEGRWCFLAPSSLLIVLGDVSHPRLENNGEMSQLTLVP